MVLNELGNKLRSSLNAISNIDSEEISNLLKEISNALIENDVNFKLVINLRNNIQKKIDKEINDSDSVNNKRKKLQKIVFDELVSLVDCEYTPVKIKKVSTANNKVSNPKRKQKVVSSHVIMMVGLQGAGKTTSCTKLAVYYKKRGYKVGLVCADTFRAGAFDQLKQNAIKSNIPFYGSYIETNPVKISFEGVSKFKSEQFDIIIVDTSGRHQQEQSLFNEMIEISEKIQPNQTIMVMDGTIGQAAESQAKAFKDASDFGSIILTKMDGHAKGGGAISAIASTKTPIIFIGVGEHIQDFEPFNPKSFISKLLGIGDINSLIDHVKSLNLENDENHKKTLENFKEGKFTLRDFQTQMNNFLKMGPLSNIASMIPGMSNLMSQVGEDETSSRIKNMIYIMDSMTTQELDSDGRILIDQPQRILRIARGSGCSVVEVEMVLQQQKIMSSMAQNAKNMNMNNQNPGFNRAMQQAQSNPNFMQQAMNMLGGAGGGAGGMPNMQQMMNNPAMIQQAQQMMRNNPAMMQQAQQMMSNPGMMQKMMQQFGGGGF